MLLRQGYDLKLTIIENWLKILMKQGRIQPVYVLSSTKERKRIKKFNKCYVKMYLLSKRHKFILSYGFKYKRKRNWTILWLFRQYKLLVLQVYDQADSQTSKDFLLNHVLKEFHFKINQIQVDSGSKFLGNF